MGTKPFSADVVGVVSYVVVCITKYELNAESFEIETQHEIGTPKEDITFMHMQMAINTAIPRALRKIKKQIEGKI